MTKKDFELIARALRESLQHYCEQERDCYAAGHDNMARRYAYGRLAIVDTATDIATQLKRTNPLFDAERFMTTVRDLA